MSNDQSLSPLHLRTRIASLEANWAICRGELKDALLKLEGALGRALTAESQRDEAMTLLNAACEAAEANWKAKAIEAERGRIAAVDRLGEQSKLIDDYRNMSDRLRNELAQSSSRLDVLLKGERCKSAGEAGHWENCCDVCKAFVVERRNPLESCGMAAGADSNQLKPRDRQ
jgi:chromosome segregation ATPase